MMYDPTRDEYHVMYQWHPYHVNWGELPMAYQQLTKRLRRRRKHQLGARRFQGPRL